MRKSRLFSAAAFLFAINLLCLAAFSQNSDTDASAANEPPPVDYGFVVDNSGSFRLLLDGTIKLIKDTIAANGDSDRVFLVRFSTSERVVLEQELTAKQSEIADSADAMYAEGGQKAIVDAVDFSAKYLAENSSEGRRKVIVLVTDGDERESVTKPEAAIERLKAAKIRLIAVGIADGFKINGKLIERLANETGGRAFLPKNQAELKALAPELAAEIHKP